MFEFTGGSEIRVVRRYFFSCLRNRPRYWSLVLITVAQCQHGVGAIVPPFLWLGAAVLGPYPEHRIGFGVPFYVLPPVLQKII